MASDEEYEVFGRDVKFDDITDIKKVSQPGILSNKYFFNKGALGDAVNGLCFLGSKDIQVYFRDIGNMDVVDNRGLDGKKWFDIFNDFVSQMKGFTAGMERRYWYDAGRDSFYSSDFNKDAPPYQAFLSLFGDAVNAFSCFAGNEGRIEFSSRGGSAEEYTGGTITSWTGKADDFLRSAYVLSGALERMEGEGYDVGVRSMGGARRREVRIISSWKGALVGSLYSDDSVTLHISEKSLEDVARS